ncbi:type VI secretion system tube protein TssD [Cellulophaga sp. L1A9]|uniref:type VI secretion system tube protein TssD n=1 Tax=Cellulophaga sp. L1A9 TaxID=2686362 RepID=UPI00131A8A59|nr:type VI secretion system tube protein TssD [Cellulophaga sp. L1A9]
MVKAKLLIDGLDINVLKFTYRFNQQLDPYGQPHQEPVFLGITLTVESQTNLNLGSWSADPDLTKQLELHIPPVDERTKIRKLYLFDCYLTNWSNNFSSSGIDPKTETIHISAGGVKESGSTTEYSAHWRVTFPPPETPKVQEEITEEEDELDLVFIAKLERLSNYQGEFGFDWMRKSYETEAISENYDKLKKEYNPLEINGLEYFTPWLSMFPKQENVKLKLNIIELFSTVKDTDIIKFQEKKGIKFEPNELKISEAHGAEITISCNSPLTQNTTISFLDKNDNEVGKINLFRNANHEQLHFNITPIRILRSTSIEIDKNIIEDKIDLGFGDVNKNLEDDLENLENYLNTKSLNQALLQCKIGEVVDIIIDEENWIANDLIITNGTAFKGDNLLTYFEIELKEQQPIAFKNKGIFIFLCPLINVDDDESIEKGAPAYANLRDIDSKNLVMFEPNLGNKESFAHEISHVAGLEHSFKERRDLTPLEIIKYNKRKNAIDTNFDTIIKSGKHTKQEIAALWKPYSVEMRRINSMLYTLNRNQYKFKKTETENFMDYANNRKSFWKFQWKALQDDIIKFYIK